MNWIRRIFEHFHQDFQTPAKPHIEENTIRRVKNPGLAEADLKGLPEHGGSEHTKKLYKLNSFKEKQWIFRVITGADSGREFIGSIKRIPVGRHPENLILLRDPKVSRFHAVFYLLGTNLFIEDLGSTNGTRVNGEQFCKSIQVYPGDQVKCGETVIQIVLEKK